MSPARDASSLPSGYFRLAEADTTKATPRTWQQEEKATAAAAVAAAVIGGAAHENLQGKAKRTPLRRGMFRSSYRKVTVRAKLNTRACSEGSDAMPRISCARPRMWLGPII